MANPMTRAGFPDLLDARLRDVYDKSKDVVENTYDKVFQMETSDRDRERFSAISGHAYPTATPEGGAIPTDGRIQDYDTSFVHVKFPLKSIITREMLDDDLFNRMSSEMSSLARVMKKNPDVQAADFFNYGFTATNSSGDTMVAADGIRHFSTLHYKNPDETGTTYSNASSTGIPLNEANLNTAVLAANQQKNARGQLAGVRVNTLIVPDDLRQQAMILTGSTHRPETADNDINAYNKPQMYFGGTFNLIVWPELGSGNSAGSATRWFLADSMMHEGKFIWRMPTTLLPVEYNNTNDTYEYMALQRFSYGMVGWRGMWGSKGDQQAYAA